MLKVYFVYNDIESRESWNIKGIFVDKALADEFMLSCAKIDYKGWVSSIEAWNLERVNKITPMSFDAYLAKEYLVVEKLVVESEKDLEYLNNYSVIVDLATAAVDVTHQGLDSEDNRREIEPHFLDARTIVAEEDIYDSVWSCGSTIEKAVAKAKNWFKMQIQMGNCPKGMVKPHISLLE